PEVLPVAQPQPPKKRRKKPRVAVSCSVTLTLAVLLLAVLASSTVYVGSKFFRSGDHDKVAINPGNIEEKLPPSAANHYLAGQELGAASSGARLVFANRHYQSILRKEETGETWSITKLTNCLPAECLGASGSVRELLVDATTKRPPSWPLPEES